MRHYENPQHVGSFDKNDPNVGTGIVGAPACGDVMKLQIVVDPDTLCIIDVAFKTFGCGSAIASSSFVTELLVGRHIDEIGDISNKRIAEDLGLPKIKSHCSVLAEEAINAAIDDYKKKRAEWLSDDAKVLNINKEGA